MTHHTLKELIARLANAMIKLRDTDKIENPNFRAKLKLSAQNTVDCYNRLIDGFGGGKNVYKMIYHYTTEPGVASTRMVEYYQADNREEAYAACTWHNRDKVDFAITQSHEIKLRNPIYK